MQAEQDSIRQHQLQARDQFPSPAADPSQVQPALPAPGRQVASSVGADRQLTPAETSPFQDDNEKKVNDRLQKIYAALGGHPNATDMQHPPAGQPVLTGYQPAESHLDQLMTALKERDTATSPQLRQVKEVLDRIMDIQHPERVRPVRNDSGQAAQTVRSVPIATGDDQTGVGGDGETNGFFGLADDPDSSAATDRTILAAVHADQSVLSGAIVKLRLLQDIFIGEQRIPANSFIYGPATIAGERVNIQLTNATYNGKIFPLALKVYDATDGLEGIYVPGMITRDVVKENMSQSVGGLNIGTLDPSLGAQAAAAGIETAKNLLSRKIRLVKATLKEGHLVILRNPSIQH